MRTNRHNRIAWRIVKAIKDAYHPTKWHLNIDAGTKFSPTEQDDDLDDTSVPSPKKQRCTIPPWALPNNTLLPDIVLILGWDEDSLTPVTQADKAKITFVIADVTLGRGYTTFSRIERKQQKYAMLITDLRNAGFKVIGFTQGTCERIDDLSQQKDNTASQLQVDATMAEKGSTTADEIGVLSFGVTGEMYKSNKSCLSAFHVSGTAADSLLSDIHLIIVRYAHRIIRQRYIIDKASSARQTGSDNNDSHSHISRQQGSSVTLVTTATTATVTSVTTVSRGIGITRVTTTVVTQDSRSYRQNDAKAHKRKRGSRDIPTGGDSKRRRLFGSGASPAGIG